MSRTSYPRSAFALFSSFLLPAALFSAATLCQYASGQNPQPPAPSTVMPNASRVTAKVLAGKVWPPRALDGIPPRVPPDQTLYSVELEILSSEAANPDATNLLEAGRSVEAFSSAAIPESIVGQTISSLLTLTGGTGGVRWILQDFSVVR